MSGVDVFIANTPLHVLYAVALTRALPSKQHEIHWFGKDAIGPASPLGRVVEGSQVVDCRRFALNGFRGYLRSASAYVAATRATVPQLQRLFTCYETHYSAEALRNEYDVPWERVGVIEDGIGSYFPHSMTRRRLQLPKALVAFAARRDMLTLSWHNLGGNPRVGLVSALDPDHVHVHPRSRAAIVPLAPEVRALLDERGTAAPPAYREADTLLFLPPVLHYGRLDEEGLVRYVERVRAHPELRGLDRLVVKPHPRDRRDDVAAAVAARFGEDVDVGGDDAIELVMRDLDNAVWAGSPTTAMLNKHILFPGRTRHILFPLAGNRHVRTQIEVLLRILGDRGTLAA